VTEIGFLSTVLTRVEQETCTVGSMSTDCINPLNFAIAIYNGRETTSGASTSLYPIHINTTDNNGNGMLVGTDRMFVYGGSAGNAVAGRYTCKILYRLTEVGITEYVGIVAGQQG